MVSWTGLIEGIAVLVIGLGTFGVTYPFLSNVLVTSGITTDPNVNPLVVLFLTICIVIVAILGSIGVFIKLVNRK